MGSAHISSQAALDLVEIWDFISDDDEESADRFITRIQNVAEVLAESPIAGRDHTKDLAEDNVRSFPVGRYMIYYGVISVNTNTVYRVLHAGRKLPRRISGGD